MRLQLHIEDDGKGDSEIICDEDGLDYLEQALVRLRELGPGHTVFQASLVNSDSGEPLGVVEFKITYTDEGIQE